MRVFLVIAALVMCLDQLKADYEVRDTKSGVVLLSRNDNDYFTLEITGKKIKQLESDPKLQLYFMVDGRFLQVMPLPLAEFQGNPKASDEENIRKYFQSESDFYKQPLSDFHIEKTELADHRTAFTGDLIPASDGPGARQQIFLIFRYGNNLMELGSVLGGNDTKTTILEYLTKIANSFVSSREPIELERIRGGTYRVKTP